MADDRSCGECSLCCTVLRVDELAKLGGRPCAHQQPGGGCGVHSERPGVCRAYRCAWLGGAFGDADRPDRLGAVLDLVARGPVIHMVVRLARPDALEASPRLQSLVEETRRGMPVELRDVEEVLDAHHPYRVLHPNGEEQRISGARLEVFRDGRRVELRRAPLLERAIYRLRYGWQHWRLARWPSHEDRLASLGLPAPSGDTLPGPAADPEPLAGRGDEPR